MLFYDKVKKRKASGRARESASVRPERLGRVAGNTTIQNSIEEELARYFELLEGQAPNNLYRMVMSQVEQTLLSYVLEECGNNQSRAAEYLGISRGTLRNKLMEHGLI